MPLVFSLELVDLIVDLLYQDSLALQRCALTSRSFAQSCRRYLFSSISLNDDQKVSRFYETLSSEDAQDICGRVRKVIIINSALFADKLGVVLFLLRSLVHIAIHGVAEPSDALRHWNSIPSAARKVIDDIFSHPSVQRIELYNFQLPSSALERRVSIDSVILKAVSLYQDSKCSILGGGISIHARALTFHLQDSDAPSRAATDSNAPEVIEGAKYELKSLAMKWKDFIPSVDFLQENYDVLRRLPLFQELHIRRGLSHRGIAKDVPKISLVLSLVPHTPGKRIVIEFVQFASRHEYIRSGWSELDDALQKICVSNGEVVFRVIAVHKGELTLDSKAESTKSWRVWMEQQLSGTMATGKLRMEIDWAINEESKS